MRMMSISRSLHLCLSTVAAVLLVTASGSRACADATQDEVEQALAVAAIRITPEARQALAKIDGTPRRLLALRAYLRAKDALTARWSWTQEQIDAFEKSPQHARMLAEIDKVTAHFEKRNRGYTLYVNTQVRSLDLQLQRWNENPRVGRLADELYAAARARLKQTADATGFAAYLVEWFPSTAAPLAAPGLSAHGQLRAIDFQVYANGRGVVAGPDTPTIAHVWNGQGWAGRLAQAVDEASDRFHGPLRMPDEPWHFEYVGSGELGLRVSRGDPAAPH
jgi:hypothetical protein